MGEKKFIVVDSPDGNVSTVLIADNPNADTESKQLGLYNTVRVIWMKRDTRGAGQILLIDDPTNPVDGFKTRKPLDEQEIQSWDEGDTVDFWPNSNNTTITEFDIDKLTTVLAGGVVKDSLTDSTLKWLTQKWGCSRVIDLPKT